MRYGTHTEACSLNGYESVIYLTILLVLVLPRISGFMSIIVLTAHTLLYSLYPPASCSLSYHAQSIVGLYVLRLWWHKIRVYRWGFPCLDYSFDVLVLWSRDLKPYNQIYSSLALLVLLLYICLPLLATWLLLHHSPGEFHLTPLDSHVQVMELGACGFSQLLIRVARR